MTQINMLELVKSTVRTEIIPHCNMDNFTVLNIGTLTGWYSYDLLSKHMLVGKKGVDYYREAHLSSWNAWIHTLGMPFSMYGMLFWIPALFNLGVTKSQNIIWFLYYMYGGHYLRINKKHAAIYYLLYFYVTKRASAQYKLGVSEYLRNTTLQRYHPTIRNYLVTKGLSITTTGLFFQEIIGHWLSTDIGSRFEAVPNAILYAIYFSASHMSP